MYFASPQDYSKELLDEKNLDQEIVETTVTITGLGNYSGKVINVFATGTLGAGDFTDAFGLLSAFSLIFASFSLIKCNCSCCKSCFKKNS